MEGPLAGAGEGRVALPGEVCRQRWLPHDPASEAINTREEAAPCGRRHSVSVTRCNGHLSKSCSLTPSSHVRPRCCKRCAAARHAEGTGAGAALLGRCMGAGGFGILPHRGPGKGHPGARTAACVR
eukprot:364952-Chlamydomonas_euryale.AAC.12